MSHAEQRYFAFLEEWLAKNTQWVAFEPNTQATWSRVTDVVTKFLHAQFQEGALQGIKEKEAYFVRCGHDTMTEEDIRNGKLIMIVGVAVLRASEFSILKFSQKTVEASGQSNTACP